MVRFSLATLPKNITIQSATLDLTMYTQGADGEAISGGSYQLYRLSKKWDPAKVTWNNATATQAWATQGGDCFSPPESTFTATGKPFFAKASVMKFIVTNTIKESYADTTKNFGWLLRTKDASLPLGTSYGMAFYATNHAGQDARYPKLVINYTIGSVAVKPALATNTSHLLSGLILKGSTLYLPTSNQTYQVTISSLNGTRIASQSNAGGRTIDLSSRPSGVYMVRINSGDHSTTGSITLGR